MAFYFAVVYPVYGGKVGNWGNDKIARNARY
jgi:hypothetical protein